MNHQDITTCRSTKPIEVDHEAMHNTMAAQMAEFERLGGRVEHIARGVCTNDPLKRNGIKAIQVVKGKL